MGKPPSMKQTEAAGLALASAQVEHHVTFWRPMAMVHICAEILRKGHNNLADFAHCSHPFVVIRRAPSRRARHKVQEGSASKTRSNMKSVPLNGEAFAA